MSEEWKKLEDKIIGLQHDIRPFKADFLDTERFMQFFEQTLRYDSHAYKKFCITGYFSERVMKTFERIIKQRKNVTDALKLISPELTKSKRDIKNLQVLKKLSKAGAEIRINHRLHARIFVAYNPAVERGLLVIGSFDFNTECLGEERRDAGIKTTHPDLVKSALELFEQIWNETESISLEDFIKKGKS